MLRSSSIGGKTKGLLGLKEKDKTQKEKRNNNLGPKELFGDFSKNFKLKQEKKKIFGTQLSKLTISDGSIVPHIVQCCISFLDKKFSDQQDSVEYWCKLFCANMRYMNNNDQTNVAFISTVEKLRSNFEFGKINEIPSKTAPNVVMGLLALFFIEIPSALLPKELFEKIDISTTKMFAQLHNSSSIAWQTSLLRRVFVQTLTSVPNQNIALARYLVKFLHRTITSDKSTYFLLEELSEHFAYVTFSLNFLFFDRKPSNSGNSPVLLRKALQKIDVIDKSQSNSQGTIDIIERAKYTLQTLIVFSEDLFPSRFEKNKMLGVCRVRNESKLQNTRQGWEEFYCVLKDNTLYCLHDEHIEEIAREISWSPDEEVQVRAVDNSLFGLDNCFVVELGKSKYHDLLFEGRGSEDTDGGTDSFTNQFFFSVASVTERNQWMRTIQALTKVDNRFSLRHLSRLRLNINTLNLEKTEKTIPSNMKKFYCLILFDTEIQARTFSKGCDCNNTVDWMAQFQFDDILDKFFSLSIVFYGIDSGCKELYLGTIQLPFHLLARTNKEEVGTGGRWYDIDSGVGRLRLEIQYTVERICPHDVYERLENFFITSLSSDEDLLKSTASIYKLIDQISTALAKSVCATALVRFYIRKGMAVKFLKMLIKSHICSTENPALVFRGNSMTSKAMDAYMKVLCNEYLHQTLEDEVMAIYCENRSYEVNESIAKENGEDVSENWTRLKKLFMRVCNRIFDSALLCPHEVIDIFRDLRANMEEHFYEQNNSLCLTVISSFIFLRLFSAALKGPHLDPFNLVPDLPSDKALRAYTLISKALQTLANLHEFDKAKQDILLPMNELFREKFLLDRMRAYLQKLSSDCDGKRNTLDDNKLVDFDIDRELATIHHTLVKYRPEMEKHLNTLCEDSRNYDVLKRLLNILNEVSIAESKLVDESRIPLMSTISHDTMTESINHIR